MSTHRKSPRAFRTSSSATQPGSPHSDSRYHSRVLRCSGNEPVGGANIGFRFTGKNDSVEKEYSEVLREIGLLSGINIMGFEEVFKDASPKNRAFLSNVKNKDIAVLLDALYQRRAVLVKQIYIRD